MTVFTTKLTLISEGIFSVENVTDRVQALIDESGIREGAVLVFSQHSTSAVMVAEHEAGIVVDLEDALERITPSGHGYQHHRREFDLNGAAHVRSALLAVSATIPILGGAMLLGQYQEVLVLNMDPTTKERSVIVQVSGE